MKHVIPLDTVWCQDIQIMLQNLQSWLYEGATGNYPAYLSTEIGNWRLTFIEAIRDISNQQTQKPVSITDMK